ncbi:hypothetical protein PHYBLDRAFT_169930 [Phycomyces blakesleeanus NRRL 1555(-)]|uniref:Uncharacterized protein n=1 Tax=Phycomyces blakesleeanus (strain ATCC 8743b / DSM 1359 / FGSC 10004 / NBRC 33097 / NRRL 1555) TaxID=763407 RepID=A0A162X1Q6_PHYB8|nr:hypothetical protein PHYBLDRAFT_169930 [Phycomyces blakesleeanus NRRL 1555(-)]OAD72025.1 hypothetical protein PHYBLDRAFT_169930 [Phycomyces blakesleeanus NRRL 1555(-)]|eukprot:XP_018290065.1 hypothetical protein PHYBLDRAFT_169930 [Phycomyces blakesleeanus NRRL 1555(-)]
MYAREEALVSMRRENGLESQFPFQTANKWGMEMRLEYGDVALIDMRSCCEAAGTKCYDTYGRTNNHNWHHVMALMFCGTPSREEVVTSQEERNWRVDKHFQRKLGIGLAGVWKDQPRFPCEPSSRGIAQSKYFEAGKRE